MLRNLTGTQLSGPLSFRRLHAVRRIAWLVKRRIGKLQPVQQRYAWKKTTVPRYGYAIPFSFHAWCFLFFQRSSCSTKESKARSIISTKPFCSSNYRPSLSPQATYPSNTPLPLKKIRSDIFYQARIPPCRCHIFTIGRGRMFHQERYCLGQPSLLLEQQVLKLQQHHNGLSRIRRTLAQPSPHKRS